MYYSNMLTTIYYPYFNLLLYNVYIIWHPSKCDSGSKMGAVPPVSRKCVR